MNTFIKITHNGEEYKLEFDRATIKMLESAGFNYQEFLEKPMTNIELAFTAAFVKNHPKIKQTVVDEIYNGAKDKTGLVAAISKMISDFYEALLADPEEDTGNVNWEMVDLTPTKKEKNQG